jgi:two-component system phosphate regulon sensor histidine kinase PhoR
MLRNKNISPVQMSLLITAGVSVPCGIMVFIITNAWKPSLIISGITAILSYSISYYLIEEFVYRKIKLIYKFISQTKATKREEFYAQELLPPKTIDEVGEEVERWAEERKVEIERLQNNEEFRREFLMNLAHELKTPIFSAQGYIETLIDGALQDPNVNQAFLQKAARGLDRLSDLVKDLDQISQIESNQVPISKQNFVIQDLIRDVYEEFSQKAAKKEIRLIIKKGCENDIYVHADRAKIKQVLVNLVENSINYGKVHGETNTGIYLVDVHEVFIEVTDNGMGIQEDMVPRVFERFFRTDAARSRNEGGSGLGLAIVKHIIEAHNHTVTCRSTPDVGTSFGFFLDQAV